MHERGRLFTKRLIASLYGEEETTVSRDDWQIVEGQTNHLERGDLQPFVRRHTIQ